jgi:ankyrin repeat protein
MHCAAQRYEGVLSIFMFNRCHNIEVHHSDRAGSTALHFATISMHIKNVQALIKLGADVDA